MRKLLAALVLGLVLGVAFQQPLRTWWLDVREQAAWEWFLLTNGCIFRFQCPEGK